MWTADTVLEAVPSCPFCGGEDRREAPGSGTSTSTYVENLLDSFGLCRERVLSAMRCFDCDECGTRWYDPWFSRDFVDAGYDHVVGRHIYGWAAVGSWVARRDRKYFHIHQRILDLLLTIAPDLRAYGELNCPFSGLAFAIKERRSPEVDRTAVQRKIHALSHMYASTELKRHYAAVDAWRTLLPALGGGATAAQPSTVLLTHDSPSCWGASCTFAGANCRSLAQGYFFDKRRDLRAYVAEGGRLDAVGVFNLLDHFPRPMEVLNLLFDVSDVLVLELAQLGHLDHQHPYNIGARMDEPLRRQGYDVVDISDRVDVPDAADDSRRYCVVTRSGLVGGLRDRLAQGRTYPRAEAKPDTTTG